MHCETGNLKLVFQVFTTLCNCKIKYKKPFIYKFASYGLFTHELC